MYRWRRMEKIKSSQKITIDEVLARVGEKRTFHNSILRRIVN